MIGRLRHGRGGLLGAARPRTPRELVATVGRVVLWLALGVVVIRGLAGTLATDRPAPAPRLSQGASAAAWPDDAARAFAVEFASACLTHSPTDKPGAYLAGLEAYASPELVGELAPRFRARAPKEVVRSAAVAGALRLDDGHALVTVAATLAAPDVTQRRLTVPIARDARGGLAVYDLPSFASAPPRAAARPPEGSRSWARSAVRSSTWSPGSCAPIWPATPKRSPTSCRPARISPRRPATGNSSS